MFMLAVIGSVCVCAEGLGLASEGAPSYVACCDVVPLAPVHWFDKLCVVFIYDIVVLQLWRRVVCVCGCVEWCSPGCSWCHHSAALLRLSE